MDAWPTQPEEVDMLAKSLPGEIGYSGSTGMYNVGIGLSPESVAAVLKDAGIGDVTFWHGKTPDLLQRLDARYLMPEPKQAFICFPWDDGNRILRRCGKVTMKGFDRPPTVWEWVGPWMDVYGSLNQFIQSAGESLPWVQALQKAG